MQRGAVGSRQRGAARNQADGQGNAVALAAIELDLERVGAGLWQRKVEDQDGAGFDFGHAGRRLAEMHRPLAFKEGIAAVIDEPDGQAMFADFRASPAHPQDQMSPRVHGRELGHPHMLEQAQHGELALLINQGVVGEDGEVEQQVSSPGRR